MDLEKLFSIVASPINFLILISIVITIHELGHYWVGRMFGAAAESFSIGFGNSLVEVKDKRGTRWRLNWLPLGGFVKFAGELQQPTDPSMSPDARPDGLVGKPYMVLNPWQRLAVSLGGPFANFVFAIMVFAGLALTFGIPEAREVRIAAVSPGMAAEAAGFRAGDVIIEAGGRRVASPRDVTLATELNANEPVLFRIRRADGEFADLRVSPVLTERVNDFNMKEKVGKIGVELQSVGVTVRRPDVVEAVGHGFKATGDTIVATFNVIRRLVTGKEGLDKLSGPLGIMNLTDKVTDTEMKQVETPLWMKVANVALMLLQLAAALSIGVGFFNLLPIPVLDGGAAVMCVVEGVSGRPVPETIQRIGLTMGLVCLVGFALVITLKDVLAWQ